MARSTRQKITSTSKTLISVTRYSSRNWSSRGRRRRRPGRSHETRRRPRNERDHLAHGQPPVPPGARVSSYQAMTHVKAMSVDGTLAYIGTGNFDASSACGTTERVALTVRGQELIRELDENLFLRDMAVPGELQPCCRGPVEASCCNRPCCSTDLKSGRRLFRKRRRHLYKLRRRLIGDS